jgi:hypothetical protein
MKFSRNKEFKYKIKNIIMSRTLSPTKLKVAAKKALEEFPWMGGDSSTSKKPSVHSAIFLIRRVLGDEGYKVSAEKYFTPENQRLAYDTLRKLYKKKGILSKDAKKSFRIYDPFKVRVKKKDKSSASGCAPGMIKNPKTGRCVSETGNIGKRLLAKKSRGSPKKSRGSPKKSKKDKSRCPPDKIRNPKTGRCVSRTGNIGKKLVAKSK